MVPDITALVGKLKQLLTPSGSLTQQSIAGGVWVAALNVSDRVLQLLMVIVVANLIGPTEFGLMGIALLSLAAFRKFSKLGLNEALIYDEDSNVDRYLNTILTMNIGRGVVIAVVVFLTAPLIATLFSEPRATDVLRAIAIAPLVYGFRNPGVIYFQKELDFQKEYVYLVSGAAVQLIVSVGYAMVIPTVWALVFGSIAKRLTQTVISHFVHPYNPWPKFDVDHAKELVNYGKWITGSSITGFLTSQGDDAVVGWILGASSLGFYQMAYQLANAPNTEVTQVISRVAFPTYSKLQDDMARLRSAFYRTVRVTLLVAMPAGIGIAVITPTFVRAFLGESWLPMVATMQLLTIYGMGVAFGSMFGEVWKAIGRPDLIAKFETAKLLLMAIIIYPLTVRYGIFGTALTVVIASVVVIRPLSVVVTARVIDASVGKIVRELAYPVVAGVGMGAVVWWTRIQLDVGSAILEFFVLVLVGIVTYVALVLVFETQLGWGLRSELRSISSELGADDSPG